MGEGGETGDFVASDYWSSSLISNIPSFSLILVTRLPGMHLGYKVGNYASFISYIVDSCFWSMGSLGNLRPMKLVFYLTLFNCCLWLVSKLSLYGRI